MTPIRIPALPVPQMRRSKSQRCPQTPTPPASPPDLCNSLIIHAWRLRSFPNNPSIVPLNRNRGNRLHAVLQYIDDHMILRRRSGTRPFPPQSALPGSPHEFCCFIKRNDINSSASSPATAIPPPFSSTPSQHTRPHAWPPARAKRTRKQLRTALERVPLGGIDGV